MPTDGKLSAFEVIVYNSLDLGIDFETMFYVSGLFFEAQQ
jgi:hypothetical protein